METVEGVKGVEAYIQESDVEQRMKKAFWQQATEILANKSKFDKQDSSYTVGLETEIGLIKNDSYSLVDEAVRNKIMSVTTLADVELGAAQLEMRTPKIVISDFKNLENELRAVEYKIAQATRENKALIVRGGTNPFPLIEEIVRTDKLKYRLVPTFHDDYKSPFAKRTTEYGKLERIDPRRADIIALFNSTQCNVQAKNLEDAIQKANISYMIAPYLVAVGTNSRFLDQRDTGIQDIRMPAWEISHDYRNREEILAGVPPRVGIINKYFENMRDYFERVGIHPLVLDAEEAALKVGIGLYWKDVRIKFIDDACVVELRPISTQPSIKEDVAMHAFYLGRLAYAEHTNEPLLDIRYVNLNRKEAMENGLNAILIGRDETNSITAKPAPDIIKLELARAREGLKLAKITGAEEYLPIIDERLQTKCTPSDLFAQEFYKRMSPNCEEIALKKAFEKVRSKYDANNKYSDCYA